MTTRFAAGAALLLSLATASKAFAADALVPPHVVTVVDPIDPGAHDADVVVVLTLTIDVDGKVEDAIVTTSGGDAFDDAALAAAKELVFAPATKNGKPIAAKIPWTYTFAAAPLPKPIAAPVIAAGALRGVVRTPAEQPMPGARVVVVRAGKTIGTATTDEAGAFSIEKLAPGGYRVRVEAEGFLPFESDERVDDKSVTTVVYRPSEQGGGVEIVVTGARPSREVTRHTLEGEEVRKIPGTNGDALRSIESMPGVARSPAGVGMLIVRGSGPNDTAIFFDGTRVPIAYHFGGITSVVPSEVLERIDFYPGNFGVEYGRAMGGIIDVGLRSPKKEWHGLLQFDLLDGRFLLEGPITERTRFLVAGRRSWIDAWLGPVLEKSGAGVTAAPVYYDGQLVVEHDLSSKTTARFAAFGSSDRLALVFNSPQGDDPITGFGSGTKFFRLQGRVESRVTDATKVSAMLSWGEDLLRFDVGDKFMDVVFRPVNARADVRSKLSNRITLMAGLDLQASTVTLSMHMPQLGNMTDAPSPYFARPSSTLAFDAGFFRPGAYVAAELSPTSSLKITPGFRADFASDIGKWDASPRVHARYAISDTTTLKGGVGVFAQTPQPWESVAPFGNEHLRSSRSIHYGVGVEQRIGEHVELSVEGFYKDLRRLVVQRPGNTPSGASFENSGSGRVYGGELLARWKNDGRFFGWIAYTLSRSERRDAPGESLRTFEFDQTHIFTALGSYKIGSGWEIGGRFRYVTGTPYTPYAGGIADLDAGGYAAIPGAPWSARTEAFHQLDLRVEKNWRVGGGSVAAYLDLQNVYNRKNPEGRAYNYNYAKSQPLAGLPILPIIGLRGEL